MIYIVSEVVFIKDLRKFSEDNSEMGFKKIKQMKNRIVSELIGSTSIKALVDASV